MINTRFFIFGLAIVSLLPCSENLTKAQVAAPSLIPVPSEVRLGGESFRLDKDFTISVSNSTDRLNAYATRFLRRLDGRTGLFLSQSGISENSLSDTASLLITTNRMGMIELGEDESYHLSITPSGLKLNAETDIGAFRGLETLLQLLQADAQGYFFPEIQIDDEPRFPWRGLLIDVCRHWLPIEVIKRNLDGMAALKMNVLHLHLTEDQGFRIESKIFPLLHQMGSGGEYFSQEQIKEIIKYASDRGIRVVPEFDMPGHTTSWFVGYPELASAAGPYEIETRYGVMDPVMDPTKEYTYEFLDQFLGEMADLFPDRFIHIGGDENNGKQWNANPNIQQFMIDQGIVDNHELQAYFNVRILETLDKYGKRMMGWDEIFQPGIPKSILIQSWRGKEALLDAATSGYQAILSNGYYIDLGQTAEQHYINDPLPEGHGLERNEERKVLGAEAAMWSEMVTAETVDSRIWPRTAAIAERLWSPASVEDIGSMYARLDVISVQLEELGLQHLRNYEMMLRRLAGDNNISAVKNLVDVIEPLKLYARHSQGVPLSTYAPFTRLADAASPESMTARKFNLLVEKYLAGEDVIQDIKDYLILWVENHRNFISAADQSPVLANAVSLSLDLSNVGKIGLQALSSNLDHSEDWKLEALRTLEAAKQPRMETELAVVSGVIRLVEESK